MNTMTDDKTAALELRINRMISSTSVDTNIVNTKLFLYE